MTCPTCGARMVEAAVGGLLLSNPPQQRHEWRCYGCGHRAPGATTRLSGPPSDPYRDEWRRLNPEREGR